MSPAELLTGQQQEAGAAWGRQRFRVRMWKTVDNRYGVAGKDCILSQLFLVKLSSNGVMTYQGKRHVKPKKKSYLPFPTLNSHCGLFLLSFNKHQSGTISSDFAQVHTQSCTTNPVRYRITSRHDLNDIHFL